MEEFYTYIFGAAIVCAIVGNYIAKQKNRSTTEGVLFGLIGGIVGLIIVALLPTKEKKTSTTEQEQRKEPTPQQIQKSKDSDFLSNLLGWFILIVVIASIVYATMN